MPERRMLGFGDGGVRMMRFVVRCQWDGIVCWDVFNYYYDPIIGSCRIKSCHTHETTIPCG